MRSARTAGTLHLSAPRMITFGVSVIVAVLAVLVVYGHISQLREFNGFLILMISYLILLAGTIFRGI